MLLDEDPATLIHETTQNFNTAPDRASLSRIASSLSTLHDSRTLRLSAHEGVLKRATRHLATLRAQHELAVAAHDPAEHAAGILALDTDKFRRAKEASDLEIEAERLEGEVAGAEALAREVEAQGARGGAAPTFEEDTQVLKLKVYRGLGVDVQGEVGSGEAWRRVLVRGSDGLRVVEGGGLRADLGGRIWDAL